MLKKMRLFKRRRSTKICAEERNRSDEQFAKVDIPNHSIDNSENIALGRPARSLQQSPSTRSSADHEITHNAFGGPAQSSVPSLASDRSCAIRSPSPVPTVPVHYEVYALPEPTASGEASSRNSCDSFDEPEPTIDTSTSFLLDATPPRTRRRRKESTAKPEDGLKSLFEEPTCIKQHLGLSPREAGPLQMYSDDSSLFGPPLQHRPSATSGITAHRSPIAAPAVHELPSDTGSPIFQVDDASPVKPLLILTPPQSQPIVKPPRRLEIETSRSTQEEPSPSQKIALAQVFMYQARMANQPTLNTKTSWAITDDSISYESKNSGPGLFPVARAEARRPRSVSTSSVMTTHDAPFSYDQTMVPRPLYVGPTAHELDGSDSGRNVVDSEAWRRKSRMLQLDSFGYYPRMVA
ncbi:hypothetical protein F5B19DRAFT_156522 [Rostrohypoxylon terebratum]|nr:hypothetical protein F5B19DRAFT_156522 [Rostrohypoxylon terebratum]